MTRYDEPDWPKWRQVVEVTIWEGVALSLLIEPSQVHRTIAVTAGDMQPRFYVSQEFGQRLLIASRSFNPKGVRSLKEASTQELEDRVVNLAAFVEWMLARSWCDEPEFVELAKSNGKASIVDTDAGNGKSRKSLCIMVYAMAVRKYGYDSNAEKNPAITKILRDIQAVELELDDETIKRRLVESASEAANRRKKPGVVKKNN